MKAIQCCHFINEEMKETFFFVFLEAAYQFIVFQSIKRSKKSLFRATKLWHEMLTNMMMKLHYGIHCPHIN